MTTHTGIRMSPCGLSECQGAHTTAMCLCVFILPDSEFRIGHRSEYMALLKDMKWSGTCIFQRINHGGIERAQTVGQVSNYFLNRYEYAVIPMSQVL